MCFLFSPRDSGGLRGASTALWEDGSAGSLEGGPGEGRRGGRLLTQDQGGPAGDAGLQALVEDLVQEHDGLAAGKAQGELRCPEPAAPRGRRDPSSKLLPPRSPRRKPVSSACKLVGPSAGRVRRTPC